MARLRKPGEGVWNIIRFNWHFYALAAGLVLLLGVVAGQLPSPWRPYAWLLLFLVAFPTIISLLVSYYVYDYSALYTFDWLNTQALPEPERVVNIHAGFDEISPQLQQKFTTAQLRVLDFYDPARHTEVSIQRARAACLPYPGTERVQPETLPLPTGSVDWVIVMLSAHEIRQQTQRIAFLEEARRSLQPRGRLVIVEHLRDPANFMAYTIGFLHFYSRATWLSAFQTAGLTLEQEQKITPFISAFILR
ncbi:hypothetical protein AM218_08520 [Hymenobacter sp. DG25A]|nr:hypothetical protein AM218_08520 [Hymenobacter sp. DG25A]